MNKKQIDTLTIEKTEYGGYVVYQSKIYGDRALFSSNSLEDCLEFIKTCITYDDNNEPRMLIE